MIEKLASTSWGVSFATAVLVHAGLALVPLQFTSDADAEEKHTIRVNLAQPPEEEPPPEPPPIEEPPPPIEEPPPPAEEPPPEPPKPKPEPTPPTVQKEELAEEPAAQSVEAAPPQPEPKEPEPVEKEPPVAEPTPPPVEKKPQPKPVDIDWQGYGVGIHRAVMKRQRYPVMARRMGMEGTVLVRIRLDRDGGLAAPPTVERSSGHQALDEEAVRMAREAASDYSAFPNGARRDRRSFVIPVRFKLR